MNNIISSILDELNRDLDRRNLDLYRVDKERLKNLTESFNRNNDNKRYASHFRSGGFRNNTFSKCSYME
jgi:hypothetical protein